MQNGPLGWTARNCRVRTEEWVWGQEPEEPDWPVVSSLNWTMTAIEGYLLLCSPRSAGMPPTETEGGLLELELQGLDLGLGGRRWESVSK